MYEVFEHTADLGLRIRARDLNGLFEEAARALVSILVENPEEIREEARFSFRVDGADPRFLLFDFLGEILHRFESERVLVSRCTALVGATCVDVTAWGEPIDTARHRLDHEVKAITYHGLRLEREGEGWLAELIVDI